MSIQRPESNSDSFSRPDGATGAIPLLRSFSSPMTEVTGVPPQTLMKHAGEFALKAAKILDAQGQDTFSPKQIMEEAVRLGWAKSPETIRHHVIDQMCDTRDSSPHQYFEWLSWGKYRLNEAGRRAAQGL